MSLTQIHILEKHEALKSILPYFGHREIDTYLCGLMAFNDDISRQDKSNFHKYVRMYRLDAERSIAHWEEGSVPLILFDDRNGFTSEEEFCNVCRYKFYEKKGLMIGKEVFDRIKGVAFMKEIKDADNRKRSTEDTKT